MQPPAQCEHQSGVVSIIEGDSDMHKYVLGGARTDGVTNVGEVTIQVLVEGDVAGESLLSMVFTCRALGDIDGNGGAEPTDLSALINALNGMPPAGIHPYAFDLDKNGGAEPGDVSLLMNILNGMPIP